MPPVPRAESSCLFDLLLKGEVSSSDYVVQVRREARARVSALKNFKVSDTPPSGPEEISGHAHEAPHNNKEIA